MKIRKSKFKIKEVDGIFNIFFLDHPLDRVGFPTKKAAKKRLNTYIKNVRKVD